jgi:murein L,D-transpeptidase YcbB/YkuD
VEDPVAPASWVLRGEDGWSADRIRAAMAAATTRVALRRRIPVLVLYGTAVVLEDGAVRFFEDLYGEDAKLERALRGESARRLVEQQQARRDPAPDAVRRAAGEHLSEISRREP